MTTLPAQAAVPMPVPLRTPEDFPLYAPGLPLVGPTLSVLNDPIGHHLRARSELGPIYRTSYLGTESLCLGGVEVNEFIWRNDKLWNYGAMRTPFAHQFGEEYLTQLDGQPHKKKRIRLNPSFRPDFLMSGTPKMNATAQENLAEVAGRAMDLRQFCYRLLLRMTTKGMLGLNLSAQEEADILQVEKDLLVARRFGPAWKLWFQRPIYRRAKKRVMEFLGKLVDRWTADPASAPQMFTLASRTAEGEMPPSRDELMGDLYLLITGGLNSNANLILWTLMYVFHRPDWVKQLQAEVAAVPPAQFSAMKQWPKIKASILEVERLRPGTVFNVLIPAEDFEFQGIAFKKGRPITHFTSLPHYQEEIYEDPLVFRPERHLEDRVYPGKAHATFGGGSHMCIGMPLARLQSPLILANILENYTVEFTSQPSFRARLGSSLTPADKTIPVIIKRRADSAV
jgi:cytochrome P450